MAALLALFSINYLVNQVVLGVVLNLLAVGITGFLFDQLVQPASDEVQLRAGAGAAWPIPGLSQIPFFGRVLFNQNILAYLAGLSVLVVWLVLFRTSWGLRIRAIGEHPEAADTVGISVRGIRWSAVLAGGLFAGLGGSFFTLASTGSFSKEFTVGNGFIALAALIMGRWHPVLAAVMCLFFGFVTQMASQLQTLSTPMPSQFLLILPYVATIIAVAGIGGAGPTTGRRRHSVREGWDDREPPIDWEACGRRHGRSPPAPTRRTPLPGRRRRARRRRPDRHRLQRRERRVRGDPVCGVRPGVGAHRRRRWTAGRLHVRQRKR